MAHSANFTGQRAIRLAANVALPASQQARLSPCARNHPFSIIEMDIVIDALQLDEEDVPDWAHVRDHAIEVSTGRIYQRATVAAFETLTSVNGDHRAFLIWEPRHREHLHVHAHAMNIQGGRGH